MWLGPLGRLPPVDNVQSPDLCLQYLVAVMLLDRTVSFQALPEQAELQISYLERQQMGYRDQGNNRWYGNSWYPVEYVYPASATTNFRRAIGTVIGPRSVRSQPWAAGRYHVLAVA
jgi:hypothetical protein